MARVNVEESAFVMARRLAFHMGWDEDLALGKLTRFWHDSQTEEIIECEDTDIAIWFRIDPSETDNLIDALIQSKAIEQSEKGFVIRGNEKHIANLKQRREAAVAGGIARWKKEKEPEAKPNGMPNASDSARPEQSSTEQSNTEQIKTNAHSRSPKFDLEPVYRDYPRKLGKSKGIAKLKREIKTEADYQALQQAVSRFVDYHTEKKTEAQYIPHFSTWVSSWRDWCDPETGSAKAAEQGIDWEEVFRDRESSA